MRGPSHDLYELIHTLNPQEVKTCRKRMRDSGSDMRKLFESLLGQGEFDEAACRKATGRTWSDNQWSVAKNYLYQSMMAALMHRRRNELSAWNVRTHLQYLELLYAKELYRQCHKKLQQISRTVEKLDDPILRNEVLQWEYRLHSRNYHQVAIDVFDTLHEKYRRNSEMMQEYLHCQYLYQQYLFVLRNKGLVQARGKLLEAFKEVMGDPMLQEDAKPSSLASQLLTDFVLGSWKYIHSDYTGAYQRFKRVIAMMEERKGWQLSHPDLYFGALYWYSHCTFETFDFEETRALLKRMDRMRGDSAYNRARLFYYKSQLQRSETSLFGDGEANLRIARQILKELPTHQDRCRPAEVVNLYFNTGLSFLMGESYEEAMHCYLTVLQNPVMRELPEFELAAKLLLLLLCLELGDREMYRHYRRSLRRLLQKHPETYPLESLVLEGLGEIAAARNARAKAEASETLLNRLASLEGIAVSHYFDFDAWFRSRAGEESLLEIYQRKAFAEMT